MFFVHACSEEWKKAGAADPTRITKNQLSVAGSRFSVAGSAGNL